METREWPPWNDFKLIVLPWNDKTMFGSADSDNVELNLVWLNNNK